MSRRRRKRHTPEQIVRKLREFCLRASHRQMDAMLNADRNLAAVPEMSEAS